MQKHVNSAHILHRQETFEDAPDANNDSTPPVEASQHRSSDISQATQGAHDHSDRLDQEKRTSVASEMSMEKGSVNGRTSIVGEDSAVPTDIRTSLEEQHNENVPVQQSEDLPRLSHDQAPVMSPTSDISTTGLDTVNPGMFGR